MASFNICSVSYIETNNQYREAREAKRGGTAPGESRVKQGSASGSSVPFELNKIYAVNPRIQKINIASPNIKNGIPGGGGSGSIATI
jgi:hypothetical protein